MSGKRLALLQAAAPGIRRVGALLTLERGATRHWLAETEKAAQQLGLSLHPMDVHAVEDLEGLFAAASLQNVDALLGFRNPTIVTHARRVIEFAERYRMPAVFDAREYADAGALMSYGPNLDEIFRRMAAYVDKVLKGADPGELPIEQPTKVELVVNLKAAQSLGLAVPTALLTQADEVIE